MMLALVALLATLLSFVGSLQPGPVNLLVVWHSLHGRRATAWWAALGGGLPELLAAFLSAWVVADWLTALLRAWQRPMAAVLGAVFVLAGAWLLWKPLQQAVAPQASAVPRRAIRGLVQGLVAGSFNPQLVVFWSGVAAWLQVQGLSVSTPHPWAPLAYGLGAFLGAWLFNLLLMLVFLRLGMQGQVWVRRSQHLFPWLLVGLGVLQLSMALWVL